MKENTKEQAVGLAVLIVLVVLAWFGGRSDGLDEARSPERREANARLELKLDRIEKAMDSNLECRAAFLNETHQIKKEQQ